MGCLLPVLLWALLFVIGQLVLGPFGVNVPLPILVLRSLLSLAIVVFSLVVWVRYFGRRSN
jgi:hypothetical protein